MRNLILILCLVVALIPVSTFAQDSTSGEFNKAFFIGGAYDSGWIGSYGFGTKVVGNVWVFPVAHFGAEQVSGDIEFAYIVNAGSAIRSLIGKDISFLNKLYIGPIAGPNVDFVGIAQENDGPDATYVTAAAGGVVTLEAMKNIGFWAYWKYNFELEETSLDLSTWQSGGGIYIGI